MRSSVFLISVQVLWAAYLAGCWSPLHRAPMHRVQCDTPAMQWVPFYSILWRKALLRNTPWCKPQFIDTGTCSAEQNEAWSYRGNNGPKNWKISFCGGRKQSPINIQTRNVKFDSNLKKLNLNRYDSPLKSATIENNGHTIHVEPTDGVVRSIQIGQKDYTLSQFHFHWGSVSNRGSEHTFNQKQFANELHLVHVSKDGGIAVVGVPLKEVRANNTEMDPLIQSLKKAEFKGDKTKLGSPQSLERLIPENPLSYYRYSGSLTTPDCNENVIWSVAKRLILIGKLQMMEFRNLKAVSKEDFKSSNGKCLLVNNYRPVQPLNGRTVYASV